MPITPTNPFKGRQYPGELILLCVRWYLRYPLAYQHVAEIIAERGILNSGGSEIQKSGYS
jgi:transposase-like protein